MAEYRDFFKRQLADWADAARRFDDLSRVATKPLTVDGLDIVVQFNPARIRSSAAKVDSASIAARRCFLCARNRPAEQHRRRWRGYEVLVNPFPICRFHLTIAAVEHIPQLIAGRIADMVDLASEIDEAVIFYNGPRCGASAPDHFHFQAVGAGELPLVDAIEAGRPLPFGVIVLDGDDIPARFDALMARLPKGEGEDEPKVNLLCYRRPGGVRLVVIPRRNHRPDFYGDGPGQMLVSPASIDLGGIMVAPRREEFDALDEERMRELYRQLCYTQNELKMTEIPQISVGIVEAESVTVRVVGDCAADAAPRCYRATDIGDGPLWIDPRGGCLEISDVVIGIGFHWEQKQTLRFPGRFELRRRGDRVLVVNHVDVETYLKSVISSEMRASASIEFLKAHAVISRSWVLSQVESRLNPGKGAEPEPAAPQSSSDEVIRWYDHDDHDGFDVCADDHCQRYQGVTMQTTDKACEAVEATAGEVLVYDGEICDARFSKCCGGVMELFSSCWSYRDYEYLQARRDDADEGDTPDLRDNDEAAAWIKGRPEAFCNTSDRAVLNQVLNAYDLQTPDFYRWKVEYGDVELAGIIRDKSGYDFGRIVALMPIERGPSGRIVRLKIVGEKLTMTVGKELEIRRWLSPTHLYSSAFTVSRIGDRLVLEGAGWGHGVGLCQIGAAVMGSKGYGYREILAHYYPESKIEKKF